MSHWGFVADPRKRGTITVQVIDWKDSSPKWPTTCWWGR